MAALQKPYFEINRALLNDIYSASLLEQYCLTRQTGQTYLKKWELRQRIYELLCKEMSEPIDLYMVGSSLNGFGRDDSDCDLCLIIYDHNNQIDKTYADKISAILKLNEISRALKAGGLSKNSQVIPAMVPILKFNDTASDIEVNININRTVTVRNTHLMYLYSHMDGRVAPLVNAVKSWARRNEINCAFSKSLSNYSLVLMTIYYLQSICYPPVLPCLQSKYPHLFPDNIRQLKLNEDVAKVNFVSDNTQGLWTLFHNFLQYYTLHLSTDKVISVRTGGLVDKSQFVAQAAKNGSIGSGQTPYILIEEPFNRTNTSHSVYDVKVYHKIVDTFRRTLEATDAWFIVGEHWIQ